MQRLDESRNAHLHRIVSELSAMRTMLRNHKRCPGPRLAGLSVIDWVLDCTHPDRGGNLCSNPDEPARNGIDDVATDALTTFMAPVPSPTAAVRQTCGAPFTGSA
jgi:hypothetical protein